MTTDTTSAPAAPAPAGRQRLVSGMQPSGDSLHLGNYLGALVNWVKQQDQYECFYFIPDLHAITVDYNPDELLHRTRLTAAQYLAGGIDLEKSTLFVQSQVPEHAQLAWVLTSLTGFGEASRMTQFKDKMARHGQDVASAGLFAYPMLMAADILLYKPYGVPVGEDQRQHLELTRTLAHRCNTRYGETFPVPEALIPPTSAKIYDLQNPTAKMSKSAESAHGLINLLDDPKVTAKKIKQAVTDTETVVRFDREAKPGVSNLLTIISTITGQGIDDLVSSYEGKMYGHLKADVAQIVVDAVAPIKARTEELLRDPAELDRLLAVGAAKAREVAAETLAEVYRKVGFLPAMATAVASV